MAGAVMKETVAGDEVRDITKDQGLLYTSGRTLAFILSNIKKEKTKNSERF